jgi:putative ABC transport system ATP-binding protein
MIELDGVSRTYEEGATAVHALRPISLSIAEGSLVAIVGPSGSGKSTLLNLLGALDRPSSGKIRIAGEDLTAMDDDGRTKLRREKIGFVFQFFNLLPTLTARENVQLPAKLAGLRDRKTLERADVLLDRVGLTQRKGHRPDQLSGGEMQRVAVARALMMDPPLVLADEPTGNLDTLTGQEVLELLIGAVDARRTVVLVTHDPKIAERADRVLEIRDGSLVSDQVRAKKARIEAV